MSRFLSTYQQFFSQATDAPREFSHASGLACLSTIALGRRWIERGTGIRPNIFLMLVADSSRDRKSTSIDLAVDILEPVEPNRLASNDVTAEGLITEMRQKIGDKERKNKILLTMREFGAQLVQMQGYAQSLPALLCELYDGNTYSRARSKKRAIVVEKPRVSMIVACAFGMLAKYGDPKDWATGFLARFLFVTPLARPEGFTTQPPYPKQLRDFARAALLDLREELRKSAGPMLVDPQAEKLHAAYGHRLPDFPDDPIRSAQRERYLNAVWKVAMLYQIDADPQQPISAAAMDSAITFIQRCWKGFERVYNATAGDDFSRICDQVQKSVKQAGPRGISKRDIYRTHHLSASRITGAIDVLDKMGVLTVLKQQTKGRPKDMLVSVDVLDEHHEQAEQEYAKQERLQQLLANTDWLARTLDALARAGCNPQQVRGGASATCPLCKGPGTIRVRADENGRVVISCATGCNDLDIVNALDIDQSPPAPPMATDEIN